jgi:hypothetical protein
MAVDLLRSCYSADVRFEEGKSQTSRVTWFFVDDSTAFLPVSCAYSSLNWVDDQDKPDDGESVGEIQGTRKYSKGEAPTWATGQQYCGTADQWAGNYVYGQGEMIFNQDGSPVCCGAPQIPLVDFDLAIGAYVIQILYNGELTEPPLNAAVDRASNLPFSFMVNVLPYGAPNSPWLCDLLKSVPPTDPETLADCDVADFPGYETRLAEMPQTIPDPGGSYNYTIPVGPIQFFCRDTIPDGQFLYGFVVYDSSNVVLFWGLFDTIIGVSLPGDEVDVYFTIQSSFDYP